MKLATFPGLIACVLAVIPISVQAEPGDGKGQATATVIEPLSARPLQDLSFGTLTVGQGAGGEVRVASTASQVEYSGTASPACGASGACAPHPARFAVSGEAERAYRVQLPASVQARGSETGQELEVSALEMQSRNQPAEGWRGTLDSAGEDEFAIGGVLNVPAATRPDTFRAELAVSVFYD